MLKSFIGADMRLYERFGVGLHNNPDHEVFEGLISLENLDFIGFADLKDAA